MLKDLVERSEAYKIWMQYTMHYTSNKLHAIFYQTKHYFIFNTRIIYRIYLRSI